MTVSCHVKPVMAILVEQYMDRPVYETRHVGLYSPLTVGIMADIVTII